MSILTRVTLTGVLLFHTPLVLASDELPPEPNLAAVASSIDETNEAISDTNLAPEIAQALRDARREYLETTYDRARSSASLNSLASKPAPPKLPSVSPTLETLASEVDELRSRLVVEKSSLLALQSPRKVKVTGSKTIFNYLDTAVYEVTSAVDHVTDIQLKPGETLTTPPTSGDTVRWSIGVMRSGTAPHEITHLVIKPLDEKIQTNLVVATDQHVYQLRLKSGPYHMPVVAWNYPEDTERALAESVKREALQEVTVTPDDLRFSYEINPQGKYPWTPVRVFDDGKKTFLQMPPQMRVSEAPALFLIEDNSEPLLLNYRVKGDYYIVDRLFEKAELRVGPSRRVTIELERPNWFERNFF
jgi:P-type conjugative transfer protein TrbG